MFYQLQDQSEVSGGVESGQRTEQDDTLDVSDGVA
jgi:hypothetical protein